MDRSAEDETRTAVPVPDSSTVPLNVAWATKIGRFQVLSQIGRGGMGVVYSAYDPSLDRRVAIKLLLSDRPEGTGSSERMQREARALARLSHPNVVSVYEVGEHEGRLYIAMEYVDGITLKEWARRHPVGPPERQRHAVEILLAIGEALAAAHRAKLVHWNCPEKVDTFQAANCADCGVELMASNSAGLV